MSEKLAQREDLARLVAEADDKWLRSMKITHMVAPARVAAIAQWNARIDRVLIRLALLSPPPPQEKS